MCSVCAVTHAMARNLNKSSNADTDVDVGDSFMADFNFNVQICSGSSDPGDVICFPPVVSSTPNELDG